MDSSHSLGFGDFSASLREDDISSQTDYEIKTLEPRTPHVYAKRIPRDCDTKTAESRTKHLLKPSMAWGDGDDDNDNDNDIEPSQPQRFPTPINPLTPYAVNKMSPNMAPYGYGTGYPESPMPGNLGAMPTFR